MGLIDQQGKVKNDTVKESLESLVELFKWDNKLLHIIDEEIKGKNKLIETNQDKVKCEN